MAERHAAPRFFFPFAAQQLRQLWSIENRPIQNAPSADPCFDCRHRDVEPERAGSSTSFGTRGSQVQILPLRPALSLQIRINRHTLREPAARPGATTSPIEGDRSRRTNRRHGADDESGGAPPPFTPLTVPLETNRPPFARRHSALPIFRPHPQPALS